MINTQYVMLIPKTCSSALENEREFPKHALVASRHSLNSKMIITASNWLIPVGFIFKGKPKSAVIRTERSRLYKLIIVQHNAVAYRFPIPYISSKFKILGGDEHRSYNSKCPMVEFTMKRTHLVTLM